jgi:hypothetical protein
MADRALAMLDVDPQGFDVMDRKLLEAVIHRFDGGPVGLDNIAASIGEERGTIEDVIEPYLIQQGYLQRTPRGRIATLAAYRHLGWRRPAPTGRFVRAGHLIAPMPRFAGAPLVWYWGGRCCLAVVAAWWHLRSPQVDACAVKPGAAGAHAAVLRAGGHACRGWMWAARSPAAWRRCWWPKAPRCARATCWCSWKSDELRAALAQAQAAERQAQARLAGLRSTGRTAAQAALAQAEPRCCAPRRPNCSACSSWWRRAFSARRGWTKRAARVDVAQAQQASARAQAQANAEAGTEVAQAQAQLALARPPAQAAQARLAQAVLRAPADARVLCARWSPGRSCSPARPC